MERQDVWFKIKSSHEEIRRIKKLAAGRGRDMSQYVRWLIQKDEREQAESTPKQGALFD